MAAIVARYADLRIAPQLRAGIGQIAIALP
jgi:hypothetical protein